MLNATLEQALADMDLGMMPMPVVADPNTGEYVRTHVSGPNDCRLRLDHFSKAGKRIGRLVHTMSDRDARFRNLLCCGVSQCEALGLVAS